MIKAYMEKQDYPYSAATIARRLKCEQRRSALDTFKEDCAGVTLKEAMTSDELSGFVPDLFTDEIIMLGQREAIARNNFPVVAQASHGEFKQRYRYKDEGAQIVGELDEIKHSRSDKKTTEFAFKKIADWPLFSFERLMDSPLQDATDEVAMSTSKIYRRENQLMWHQLATFSQKANADEWENYIQGPDSSGSSDLIDAMTDAYLDMTVRLTDRFDPASLTWFISPTVFSTLFKDSNFRRFDILGAQPNIVTGTLPSLFRIPYVIIEPGYFTQGTPSSQYANSEYDIYLVATRFAGAIRERVSLRMEPITIERIQAQGPQMWERLVPYVRHPMAYRRISPTEDYTDLIAMQDILVKPQIED